MTHQATSPTIAAYDPDTMKNVPKYFTPMAVWEMLIEKPTRHMRRPVRMQGERSLSASEAVANAMSVMTAGQWIR